MSLLQANEPVGENTSASSHTTSLLSDQYHTILLGDGGTSVWMTFPLLLCESRTARSQNPWALNCKSNHYTITKFGNTIKITNSLHHNQKTRIHNSPSLILDIKTQSTESVQWRQYQNLDAVYSSGNSTRWLPWPLIFGNVPAFGMMFHARNRVTFLFDL